MIPHSLCRVWCTLCKTRHNRQWLGQQCGGLHAVQQKGKERLSSLCRLQVNENHNCSWKIWSRVAHGGSVRNNSTQKAIGIRLQLWLHFPDSLAGRVNEKWTDTSVEPTVQLYTWVLHKTFAFMPFFDRFSRKIRGNWITLGYKLLHFYAKLFRSRVLAFLSKTIFYGEKNRTWTILNLTACQNYNHAA